VSKFQGGKLLPHSEQVRISTLKIGADGSFEKFVATYENTQSHYPENYIYNFIIIETSTPALICSTIYEFNKSRRYNFLGYYAAGIVT
jgi:hypothetical protein